MNKKKFLEKIVDIHLDCFGEFECSDPICRKKCIISIKCSIEKSRSKELFFTDDDLMEIEDNNTLFQ